MGKRVFWLFFISLWGTVITEMRGQPNEWRDSIDYNPNYIIDYSDQLSVRGFASIRSTAISHHDDYTRKSITYKPNENIKMGLGASTDWFSLNIAFNWPLLNNDDAKYGKTKALDIQSNVFLRYLAIDLVLQQYKGYYISNPESYIQQYNLTNYPQRPDLKTINAGISGLYVFNHENFSYRAAFTQTERQVKSAGSWVSGIFFNYFTMTADSTLIPNELNARANYQNDFRNTDYYNFGITGGYAYNLVVFKRVFLSMTCTLGIGPEIEKAKSTDQREPYSNTVLDEFIAIRVALGYNGTTYYGGLSAFATSSGAKEKEAAYLERGVNNFKIYFGRRFIQPNFLDKPKNKLFKSLL
ncbi:DUF4421 domain-containing protein [Reichenbachiella agarivorans]|uniref:DUF4421 domain-containing protein n=1 Tax=Reichenbachiella agarivorans TaxID=2979464 RepID=A0ABY6CZX6_9BACT|nr:DUF4421 domain-containing protein [Reichenbachiella agarivorans]UXP33795.1 DUF4421 domain-containing protein [Reichenbachiella agarivorans]